MVDVIDQVTPTTVDTSVSTRDSQAPTKEAEKVDVPIAFRKAITACKSSLRSSGRKFVDPAGGVEKKFGSLSRSGKEVHCLNAMLTDLASDRLDLESIPDYLTKRLAPGEFKAVREYFVRFKQRMQSLALYFENVSKNGNSLTLQHKIALATENQLIVTELYDRLNGNSDSTTEISEFVTFIETLMKSPKQTHSIADAENIIRILAQFHGSAMSQASLMHFLASNGCEILLPESEEEILHWDINAAADMLVIGPDGKIHTVDVKARDLVSRPPTPNEGELVTHGAMAVPLHPENVKLGAVLQTIYNRAMQNPGDPRWQKIALAMYEGSVSTPPKFDRMEVYLNRDPAYLPRDMRIVHPDMTSQLKKIFNISTS